MYCTSTLSACRSWSAAQIARCAAGGLREVAGIRETSRTRDNGEQDIDEDEEMAARGLGRLRLWVALAFSVFLLALFAFSSAFHGVSLLAHFRQNANARRRVARWYAIYYIQTRVVFLKQFRDSCMYRVLSNLSRVCIFV